jgi:DNA-binding protein HU-beta
MIKIFKIGESKMNKTELITQVSTDTNLSKTDSTKALEAILNTIISATQAGDKVALTGFGSFTVTERKAREGRNPRTGDIIKIPASKVPKFIAGKTFKDKVNG